MLGSSSVLTVDRYVWESFVFVCFPFPEKKSFSSGLSFSRAYVFFLKLKHRNRQKSQLFFVFTDFEITLLRASDNV